MIGSLRQLVNLTIPYSWDDSLSVYEFIGKLTGKINELINLVNEELAEQVNAAVQDRLKDFTTDELLELMQTGDLANMIFTYIDETFSLQLTGVATRFVEIEGRATALETLTAGHTTGINTHTAEIADLDLRLDTAETDISNLKTADTNMATTVSGINARVGTAETDINSLETELGTTNGYAAGLNTRISTAETDISNLKTADTNMGNTVSGINIRLGTAETDIGNLKTADTNLGNTISGINTRLGTAETDIGNLKTADTGMLTRIGALETGLGGIPGDLSGIDTRVDNVETGLTNLGTRVSTAETDITAIENHLVDVEDRLNDIAVNAKIMFDLIGDGITDETTKFEAIAAYVNSRVYSTIYIPAGTYKLNKEIDFNKNFTLYGDSNGETVLDWSNATGAFPNWSAIYAAGLAPLPLPSLSTNRSIGDRVLTFQGTHNLLPGDIITILDSTAYSFSLYRNYYRTGEMAKVISVSGLNVTLDNPLFHNYTANANLKLYKLRTISATIHDLNMRFKPTAELGNNGLTVEYGKDCSLYNLIARGTNQAHISTYRCWNTFIDNINIDYNSTDVGYNYGVCIVNSTKVRINNSTLKTGRHGLTIGGNDALTSALNRDVIVTNSIISSYTITGADIHGNSEWITYENCVIDNGFGIGGSNITISGCKIRTDMNGTAISMNEMVDGNFNLLNNKIYCPIWVGPSGDGNGVIEFVGTNLSRQGLLNIVGNHLELVNGGVGMFIYNASATIPLDVNISGNTVRNPNSVSNSAVGIMLKGLFDTVYIEDNKLSKCDIALLAYKFKFTNVSGNDILYSKSYGIQVASPVNANTDYELHVKRNNVIKPGYGGVLMTGVSNAKGKVYFENNTVYDCNEIGGTGSTATDSAFFIDGWKYAFVKHNIMGDLRGTPKQARAFGISNVANYQDVNNTVIGTVTAKYNTVGIGSSITATTLV